MWRNPANIDYDDLLTKFMLQRRPYTNVADVLECQYQHFLSATGLSSTAVAPFDFILLRTRPDGRESFRWILGHNKQKFKNILENWAIFEDGVDLVFKNIGRYRGIGEYYRKVIKQGKESDPLDFITAVFHLTFHFHVPAHAFNNGVIHSFHKSMNAEYYCAKQRLDLPVDLTGVPSLQIDGQPPKVQVSPEFYQSEYLKYERFYKRWMPAIQGFFKETYSYEFNHHLYFPIYDGMESAHSSLRGYLGLFFKKREHIEIALHYFNERKPLLRNISEAFKKGSFNNIVDNYAQDGSTPEPIEYWSKRIKTLHQWGQIKIQTDQGNPNIFSIKDGKLKAHIGKLLVRGEIRNLLDEELIEQYENRVLSLEIPLIMPENAMTVNSPYLKKRFREIVQLLDEILKRRYILTVSRKSAVAAVMARNESHNLGSHVIARICSAVNSSQTPTLKPQSLTNFLSFIRTRKDFIADLSTNTPAVGTSMRFYQGVMSYFKPLVRDEEAFEWQRLLLDYISGIDGLNSENIEIIYQRGGEIISLANRDIDLVFGSPNGILGSHALYIIIENIIRNCAKHAFGAEQTSLKIVIEISKKIHKNNLVEICVYDNLQNAQELQSSATGLKPLVNVLNQKIKESILDHSGNLRHEAWGVLEMKICAAYLRRMSPELLDAIHSPALLEAVDIDGNLGYKFFLPLTDDVLFIDASHKITNKRKWNEKLKDKGSAIVSRNRFRQLLLGNIQYRFLVLIEPDETLLNEIQDHHTALPVRIMTTNQVMAPEYAYIPLEKVNDLIDKAFKSYQTFLKEIWHFWIKEIDSKAQLLIRMDENITLARWQNGKLNTVALSNGYLQNLDPFEEFIIYDRHGVIYREFENTLPQRIDDQQIVYYESIPFASPIRLSLERASNNNKEPDLIYKLVEAGLTKVLLLDERIQTAAEANQERHENRDLMRVLEDMNIKIPPKKEIDLDMQNLQTAPLRWWLRKHLQDADFAVIHLGILDKLFNCNVEYMKRFIHFYQERAPKLNIIILSGRGMPNEVRQLKARFVQYSQIVRYILEERSKYHLCKVLYSSRRAIT